MDKIVWGLSLILLTGCATVDVVHPEKKEIVEAPPQEEVSPSEELTKYSEHPFIAPASDRDYKRMTKQQMEDESDLQAGAGSLWVMEGQTSYLFAQNKLRKTGDPVQIKVEGSALKQIEMKVATIQDLLKDLENQKKEAEEKLKNEEKEKQRLADLDNLKREILNNGEARNESSAQAIAEERMKERQLASVDKKAEKVVEKKEKEEKIDLKEIELIPSKIVEKMPDGMLRVTGQQLLMIKKRPYKVIATGLIRPEDFEDPATSSNKLFEPQFDILHVKKNSVPTVSQ